MVPGQLYSAACCWQMLRIALYGVIAVGSRVGESTLLLGMLAAEKGRLTILSRLSIWRIAPAGAFRGPTIAPIAGKRLFLIDKRGRWSQ